MSALALTPTSQPTAGASTAEAGPHILCTIRDPRIPESSGLAAAGSSLYTVNDGGFGLRVFVLDRTCRVRRVISGSVDPYDVEDLARAPDGTLWLADTGDNDADRSTVALERLAPDGGARLFRLRYPDGPHDAEALLLDVAGRPYVVTKEPLTAGVYTPTAPLSSARPTALRRVATLSFAPTGTAGGPVGTASQVVVTGGSVSADGRLVVLRTYTDAYIWSAPDSDIGAALGSGRPTRIPLPPTNQGEAVAVSPAGDSLLTTTEGLPGPVHEVPLGDAAPRSAASPSGDASPSSAPGTGRDSSTGGLLGLAIGVAGAGAVLLWLGRLRARRAGAAHRAPGP
jgi:hypothetical protein